MKSPQAGIILCGDFSQLPIKSIISCHPDLKQLVKENTRGKATLDLIITNLDTNYSVPSVLAPVGSSDHCTVLMVPLVKKNALRRGNIEWVDVLPKKEEKPLLSVWPLQIGPLCMKLRILRKKWRFLILISRQLCKYACHCKGKL